MFIPPWYQPPIVQHVLKLVTKLPYKKLQYPTCVKDINLDVHIIVFKKAIKANGETIELTSSTYLVLLSWIIFLNGE
jgi:hypothetical protein